MKKIFLFLLISFFSLPITFATSLSVKSNLESGEYHFPIEVNLIANDKNAKIFYYTDGEGRMDHLKEFTTPILLKENTTIDFYATNKNYEDTLIQSVTYTFSYSHKIQIDQKNGKIILKNNSGDIQNIGYWKIQADSLNYEINPNTYLENRETYTLDYTLSANEKVELFSPDNILQQTFLYKTPMVEEIKKEKPENMEPKNEEKKEEPITSVEVASGSDIAKDPSLPIQVQPPMPIEEKKEPTLSLNTALKASVLESSPVSKDEKSRNLWIILGILVVFGLYNIGLFLKKNDTFGKIKTKINKIGKK